MYLRNSEKSGPFVTCMHDSTRDYLPPFSFLPSLSIPSTTTGGSPTCMWWCMWARRRERKRKTRRMYPQGKMEVLAHVQIESAAAAASSFSTRDGILDGLNRGLRASDRASGKKTNNRKTESDAGRYKKKGTLRVAVRGCVGGGAKGARIR